MSEWFEDYFADADSRSLPGFLNHFTEDAVFIIGNSPELRGKEAIGESVGAFWASITGMQHRFVNTLVSGETAFVESKVGYELKDGTSVTLPAATVLHRRDDLIDQVQVYMDASPLAGADAPA